jgi:hypothetical protein
VTKEFLAGKDFEKSGHDLGRPSKSTKKSRYLEAWAVFEPGVSGIQLYRFSFTGNLRKKSAESYQHAPLCLHIVAIYG